MNPPVTNDHGAPTNSINLIAMVELLVVLISVGGVVWLTRFFRHNARPRLFTPRAQHFSEYSTLDIDSQSENAQAEEELNPDVADGVLTIISPRSEWSTGASSDSDNSDDETLQIKILSFTPMYDSGTPNEPPIEVFDLETSPAPSASSRSSSRV